MSELLARGVRKRFAMGEETLEILSGVDLSVTTGDSVAILGVSRSDWRPVWIDDEFTARLMLPLSLSYDHRVIDGAAAVRFTTRLRRILADVRSLVL